MTILEYKEKKQRELKEKTEEYQKILQLLLVPGLKVHTNRWGKERFYTSYVNTICSKCEISHNCGCCSDSPIEVWPYTVINEVKIYSDPPSLSPGYGDNEDYGWEEKFRKHQLGEVIIEKVRNYFKELRDETESDD